MLQSYSKLIPASNVQNKDGSSFKKSTASLVVLFQVLSLILRELSP